MSSNSESAGIAQDDTADPAPDGVADRARDSAPERATDATEADPSRPRAPQPTSPSPRGWPALRPLLLRLHFYAGILIAPFLLIAAVTGLLYAGSFQAEKIVYAHELRVPVGDHRLPLTEQVAAARSAHPEGTVNAVRPGAEPDATTRVLLDVPGLEESHRLAVFVDPYTGTVRGALDSYGSSGALPLRTWIDQLHGSLLLGDAGRIYSELAASWLWVVTAGGVALWIGRRRTANRLRRTLLPEQAATGRRRTMSWHGAVGIWAALGFFFLSATGLTWSQYAGQNVTDLRAALSWETPAVSGEASAHHQGATDHGAHSMPKADVGVDRALKAARGEGLSDPVEITYPANPGAAYTVKQIRNTWPEKQDAVAVDATTGSVTDVVRFQDWPLAAKLSRWGIDAHMGLLFGLTNQIALAILMIALICVIIWGYRMWWLRRPTRTDRRGVGRPPARGAWRRIPLHILAPSLLLAAAICYFLPLLGIPLLTFLAADIALATLHRRRTQRATTTT
ncbi:PepSY-associated TM helix domain-containing protein [Streptomyces sp. NPDC048248]|uniref:PepSY-associated TM helix domain-containing protein n=1 Tax=Streptomyces sp. NPDC048248 TaxID=3365523 RepID=UPI0037101BF3